MTTTRQSQQVQVGDAELYVEVRGTGPAVLLVPGAAGDGGQYTEIAERLAAGRTVITYDRRSNSRSSRLNGWESTSVEQHADDAVGLLTALGIESAAVFGNSTGALIAFATALRSSAHVRALVLHEPTLIGVLADPESAMSAVQPVIAAGMEQGGLPGGAEAFLRFAAGAGYERLPADVRARMVGNAEVLFQAEFGPFMSWTPDPELVSNCQVPTAVLSATETAPFFREAAEWVAERLHTTVGTAPGGHMGFLDDPAGFADVLVPLLDR
jgi:pimeloyl-ACP methyl ester carboxylesterase